MAEVCQQLDSTKSGETFKKVGAEDGSVFTEKKGSYQYFAPGALVQPCSSIETLMGFGGIYGIMNTVQAIWLDSKTDINPEQVKEALWILSRQIPHLQLCLSRRGMRLWFKRMKTFSLDFKTTTKDVMEIYQKLIETEYDLFAGPLWKVRLIFPETEEKAGSHSVAIIFSVQHSITDGTSNMRICREFVSILNKISKGMKVEPKVIPLPPIIDNSIKVGPRVSFLAKYFCRKFTSIMLKNYYHKSSFNGALPVPKTKEANTKVLFDDFSKTETKNLIKMCKAAQITVHSFISAVTNFALLTVAQSRSDELIGRKSISGNHCVNMRRYFEDPRDLDATGCHISFLEQKTKMSLADAKDFWSIAKQINHDIRDKLEIEKHPMNIVPLIQMASMIFPMNSFLTKKGRKNKTDSHYVTTNMGNLKDMLPGPKEGDNIEISYILRSVASQMAGCPFILTFHTFRERFMISIDYYTNKMAEEVAQEFFAVLCQYIRNMTNLNTLEGFKKC